MTTPICYLLFAICYSGCAPTPKQNDRRLPLIIGPCSFSISHLRRDAKRRFVFGCDQTRGIVRLKMARTPSVHRMHGLDGKTSAVGSTGKHPPRFRSVSKRRFKRPLQIGKPHFAQKISSGFFFDNPITKRLNMNYLAIWLVGNRNKYVTHRTTANSHLTTF